MKAKKSQVTIFIIFGIVILVVFGLIFYFKLLLIKLEKPSEPAILKAEPTKNYIEECSKNNELCSLLKMGDISNFKPIEKYKELSQGFISSSFKKCIQNLPESVKQGAEIDGEEISTETAFNDKDTVFLTTSDLSIELEEGILRDIPIRNTHKIRFKKLHEYTTNILKSQKVRLDYLKTIDVNQTIYKLEDKKQYILEDSEINGNKYGFLFVD